jgi:hypothetical protein
MLRNRSLLFAVLLIGIGVVLLLQQADVIPEDLSVWPIILIGVGVVLVAERIAVGGRAGAGFVLPLILIAVGVGSLLQDTGTFEDDDVMAPLIAIAIGAGLILGAIPSRRSRRPERAEIDLAGATRARVEIDHGAGELRIRSHLVGGNLVEGTFAGGVDVRQHREGDLLEVTLKANPWSSFPWPRLGRLDWSVTLARQVPIELALKTGASRTEADLSDVQVESLRIDTGASSTRVTIPGAGRPQVRIQGGAAEIRVTVPGRMAARIEARGGLSNIRVDPLRFPFEDGVYRSRDYDEAPSRADIVIEAGAASVEVA